jgi:hypothetical protein
MISEYQCKVHKEHYKQDQEQMLDEFVAYGNSKFGVNAAELKSRMACCDNPKVIASLNSALSESETLLTSFPPYCCKTTGLTCPADVNESAIFTYAKAGSDYPFNGVCYATGNQVKSIIKPSSQTLPTPPPPPTPSKFQSYVIVTTCVLVCGVIIYIYFKTKWENQKRAALLKKLVRGLEGIDEVY